MNREEVKDKMLSIQNSTGTVIEGLKSNASPLEGRLHHIIRVAKEVHSEVWDVYEAMGKPVNPSEEAQRAIKEFLEKEIKAYKNLKEHRVRSMIETEMTSDDIKAIESIDAVLRYLGRVIRPIITDLDEEGGKHD